MQMRQTSWNQPEGDVSPQGKPVNGYNILNNELISLPSFLISGKMERGCGRRVCLCMYVCVKACCQHFRSLKIGCRGLTLMMTLPGGRCNWHVWSHKVALSLNSPWCRSHDINPPSMNGYKYPPHWATAQKTQSCNHRQLWGQKSIEKTEDLR